MGQDGGHALVARRRHGQVHFSARSVDSPNPPVAAALPSTACVTRVLETPLKSKAKALRVLPSLLDIQLPFALEDCVYGFSTIRRIPTGTASIACAARKGDIEEALSNLNRQGVDPAHLYPEPFVLWQQALRESTFATGEPAALLFVSTQHYTLILGDGPHMISTHGGRLDAEGNLPEATLVQLLRRAGPTRHRWLICGPGNPALLEHLQKACSTHGAAQVAQDPANMLPKALAAAALEPSGSVPDFRSGPFEHPMVQQNQNRDLVKSGLLYGLAGLILAVTSLGTLFVKKATWQESRSDLVARATRFTGYAPQPGMEVLEAERAVEAMQPELMAFKAVYSPGPISTLDTWLRTAQQAGLKLNRISIQTDTTELAGVSPAWEDSEALLVAVQARYPDARLVREDAGRDEQIHFTILSEGVHE